MTARAVVQDFLLRPNDRGSRGHNKQRKKESSSCPKAELLDVSWLYYKYDESTGEEGSFLHLFFATVHE